MVSLVLSLNLAVSLAFPMRFQAAIVMNPSPTMAWARVDTGSFEPLSTTLKVLIDIAPEAYSLSLPVEEYFPLTRHRLQQVPKAVALCELDLRTDPDVGGRVGKGYLAWCKYVAAWNDACGRSETHREMLHKKRKRILRELKHPSDLPRSTRGFIEFSGSSFARWWESTDATEWELAEPTATESEEEALPVTRLVFKKLEFDTIPVAHWPPSAVAEPDTDFFPQTRAILDAESRDLLVWYLGDLMDSVLAEFSPRVSRSPLVQWRIGHEPEQKTATQEDSFSVTRRALQPEFQTIRTFRFDDGYCPDTFEGSMEPVDASPRGRRVGVSKANAQSDH